MPQHRAKFRTDTLQLGPSILTFTVRWLFSMFVTPTQHTCSTMRRATLFPETKKLLESWGMLFETQLIHIRLPRLMLQLE